MSMWTMIFLLAIGGMIFAAWRHHHDARHGIVRDSMGEPIIDRSRNSAREEEMSRELADLRDRVKVLERIATEDRESLSLAREIEQLRDERSKSQ